MSHVYCPECGFQNPETANYCSRCGALLAHNDPGQETTMTYTPGDDEEKYRHLTILVRNEEGYRNLLRLVTDALATHIETPPAHTYYLCGPPPMIAATMPRSLA